MRQKVIHVGIGVFGKRWCRDFLKANVDDGTIEVVAIADVDPKALEFGRAALGLPAERCYTDPRKAFAENKADFCTVVVTPAYHEAIIDLAIEHGVDILCEKPIADTMEASVRIARKVKQAGRKMAVTMSHRFDQDKTTLRRIVQSGVLGKVNAVSMRYHGSLRRHLEWSSEFRHKMQDPLLIEGAIHHLDIIADFAGARCDTLYANTWKPAWAEYVGDTDAIVTMMFENGVRGLYEGSCATAVGLNMFYNEYIRIDGENGSVVMNHRDIEVFIRQDFWRQQNREGRGQKIELMAQPKWINYWLFEKFAKWRDGGPPMETEVQENLQASALVFASIESKNKGAPVKVQDYIGSFRD
jgi:predicted dehydrogenase